MRPGPAQQPGPAVAPAPQAPQLAPAPQAPQLAPAPQAPQLAKAQQAPQHAPKPVAAVQVAPQAAVATPAAAPPAVTTPAVVSSAPAPKMPANVAGIGTMPWLKGLNAEPFWSNYRKFAALGTEGMRAGMEAGAILVRGVDQLAQEMAALAGEQIVSAAAAAQEIGTCRSFDALVAKQSALAQASYARLTAAADKLSLMSVALVEEVCEPISDEIDAAADRFIKTLAR
jgi:hypothetical protein